MLHRDSYGLGGQTVVWSAIGKIGTVASTCDSILRKHLQFSHYEGNPVILLEQDGILLRHTQLQTGRLHQRIGFSFDRMGAHFVVNAWLSQHADARAAMRLFDADSPLLNIVKNKTLGGRLPSLLEALLAEWRERFSSELFDLHGRLAELREVRSAFLSSLAFVHPEHFTDSTSRWLISFIVPYLENPPASLNELLPLIGRCRVPSMVSAIHQWLAGQGLATRDAWWTVNIAWHGDGIPLMPVVSWAVNGARGADWHERLAAATALAWCTTTTNGFARSKLTKAIVHILDVDLSIATPLLERFHAVSDSYVLQSVAQAIHGACIRAHVANEIVGVANTVVRLWPNKSAWPCDLIIRDELLGILECAVFNDPSCGVAAEAFEPPYASIAPIDAPAWTQIDEWRKDVEQGGAAMREVIDSCMPMGRPGPFGALGYGDFGRYVVSSRVGRFFPRERLDKNREPQRTVEPFERDFAHRWIIGRVRSLGWTVERFKEFESRQLHAGRSTPKRERIGKKYQWIALAEFLARATDRYPMHDHSWRSDVPPQRFRFAGELLYESHCDTSLLIESNSESHSDMGFAWWDKRTGRSLNAEADNVTWLREPSDFPDPRALIQRDDDAGDSWLALWGHYRWHTLPSKERLPENDSMYRELWTHVRGHLIRPTDLVSLRSWMRANRAWGNLFELFATYSHEKFGELFWSKRANDDVPLAPGLDLGWKMPGLREWPKPRIPLAASFINEYDASFVGGSLSALVPNPWLARKLTVKVRCKDCSFRNSGGICVVQSPALRQPGSDAVLCRSKEFRDLATKEKLTPVWIVIGEKHVHRSDYKALPTWPWLQGLYWMEDGKIAGEHRVEQ